MVFGRFKLLLSNCFVQIWVTSRVLFKGIKDLPLGYISNHLNLRKYIVCLLLMYTLGYLLHNRLLNSFLISIQISSCLFWTIHACPDVFGYAGSDASIAIAFYGEESLTVK